MDVMMKVSMTLNGKSLGSHRYFCGILELKTFPLRISSQKALSFLDLIVTHRILYQTDDPLQTGSL